MSFIEQAKKLILSAEVNGDYSKKIIFIHGAAGTGKSYLLKQIRKENKQFESRSYFLAPTGIAAHNIDGRTIHSLFSLKPSNIHKKKTLQELQNLELKEFTKPKETIRSPLLKDTIVIDEISMVRADLFDKISELCKIACGNTLPFGGLRIILIGDMYQLPPVVINNGTLSFTDRIFLENYGKQNAFFFKSRVWSDIIAFNNKNNSGYTAVNDMKITFIELTEQFRQKNDVDFFKNLDSIRNNDCSNLDYFKTEDRNLCSTIPFLTFYKQTAQEKNEIELKRLTKTPMTFKAKKTIKISNGAILDTIGTKGENLFTDNIRAEEDLKIAINAKVMFIENNGNEYQNGTLGIVKAINKNNLNEDIIIVQKLDNGKEIIVNKYVWKQNIAEYDAVKKIWKKEAIFEQFPLILAYAMTVHKAQGSTLESAFIDFYHAKQQKIGRPFDFGQLYVALSRVKNSKNISVGKELDTFDVLPKQCVGDKEQVDNFIKQLKITSLRNG
ncbi:MAG: AAA family ATPase [Elusimicrobiota bacterium]|jgi:ATP-dependent exoDNAse (exonuclease V) alpha subunit|nr:AAA family ATPase [Elusimicrobiota bacterium]